ncbi:unnamed protein product [Caretta caretta]
MVRSCTTRGGILGRDCALESDSFLEAQSSPSSLQEDRETAPPLGSPSCGWPTLLPVVGLLPLLPSHLLRDASHPWKWSRHWGHQHTGAAIVTDLYRDHTRNMYSLKTFHPSKEGQKENSLAKHTFADFANRINIRTRF